MLEACSSELFIQRNYLLDLIPDRKALCGSIGTHGQEIDNGDSIPFASIDID